MLLDKLLANISVHVDPFAMCLLTSGWRLALPAPPEVLVHFVLKGSGVLRGPDGEAHTLERSWLAVVQKGVPHVLECGRRIQSSAVIDQAPPLGSGVTRLVAGSGGPVDFEVACGVITVSYGDSLNLFQRLQDVIVADLSGFPQVRVAFESILAEQGGLNEGSGALTQALMSQCLVYLLRYLSQQPDQPRSPG